MTRAGFRPGGSGARRAVSPASEPVRTGWIPGGEGWAHLAEATVPGVDAAAWLAAHRARVEGWLDDDGAVLLRGFAVPGAEDFAAVVGVLGPPLPYLERAARRTEVAPGVFTSTELAADQVIPLHHEMSYAARCPRRIHFYCKRAALEGGATPIAPERRVTPEIPPEIRARFCRNGVEYSRVFGDGLDLSWRETFQTGDRAAVEAYAAELAMSVTWLPGDRLRTVRRGPAMVRHPRTGEPLWFNHVHLFHPSNLDGEMRDALHRQLGAAALPRNVHFGDGAPIPDSDVVAVRRSYDAHALAFAWRAGDVLLLDNFLVVHGRHSFSGDRRILVSMSELVVLEGVADG